jgi:hypothetical protein
MNRMGEVVSVIAERRFSCSDVPQSRHDVAAEGVPGYGVNARDSLDLGLGI